MRDLRLLRCATIVALLSSPAHAGEYGWEPLGPVTFLAAAPEGSAADRVVRAFAEVLSEGWGSQINVANLPDDHGARAVAALAIAPSRSTVLFAPSGIVTAAPVQGAAQRYDPFRDLVAVSALVEDDLAFVVPASLGVSSLAEFLARASTAPGEMIYYAAPGTPDLVFTKFQFDNGTVLRRGRYDGAGETAVSDLAAGKLQALLAPISDFEELLADETVRILAITNPERSQGFPDVPTVREEGYPELTMVGVLGAFAGPDFQSGKLAELAADLRRAAQEPIIRASLSNRSQRIVDRGPEQYSDWLADQRKHWRSVAADYGIALGE